MAVRFGPFQFDPDDGSLVRDGEDVPLPPRARDTLSCLVGQAGKVVAKEALIDTVWGEAHVSDTALKEAVFLVRRALGDDPQKPSYIQTVHRRGYRFVAPVEVDTPLASPSIAEPSDVETVLRRRRPWFILSGGVVLALAVWIFTRPRDPDPRPVIRATLDIPSSHQLWPVGLALSADAGQAVYVGKDDDRRLYRRRLDGPDSEPVAGSEGARRPFFSPDGRWLGFFADGQLKVVPVEGGASRALAPAPRALGGAWTAEGTIIYAGEPGAGLHRVAVDGGSPEVLTRPDPEAGEEGHRWPEVLPGTRAVLYTVWRGSLEASRIARLDLATGRSSVLVEGGSQPRYLPPGFLLYARGHQVRAVRYGVRDSAVTGVAVPVLDGIETSDSQGAVELAVGKGPGSPDGVALYTPANPDDLRTLDWLDFDGRRQPVPIAPDRYQSVALDAGGGRAALTVADDAGTDVWIVDLDDGGRSRLTFDGGGGYPVWTPDGDRVVYSSLESGDVRLVERRVDAQGEAREVVAPGPLCLARRVTADGRLIYTQQDPDTARWRLLSVALDAPSEPRLLFEPDDRVRSMALSVDGAWLAYEARSGTAWEIHLRRWDGGGPWQLSLGGGSEPRWDATGRLYYRVGEGLTRLTVADGERFEAASREALVGLEDALDYQPGVDGGNLLLLRAFSHRPRHLGLILGWDAELESRLRGLNRPRI